MRWWVKSLARVKVKPRPNGGRKRVREAHEREREATPARGSGAVLMCGGRWFDRSYDSRLMDEADEVVRAEERERWIEKTPVRTLTGYGLAVHADEAMRDTWATARKLEAIEAVLRRKLPGLEWAAPGVMVREIAEEILAAAETAI